jgi:negative regulator of flagellin synthesis FlgM
MKVNSGYSNSASSAVSSKEAQSTKKTTKPSGPNPAANLDKIKENVSGSVRAEVSARAKEMATAHQAAKSAPDVREDKIEALKRQIAEGRYKVDADAVAERMLNDHMLMPGA